MLIVFFRSIVLYIIVLIVMRLMGKREIGQLQPFELAISIMIADLAAVPMAETEGCFDAGAGIPVSLSPGTEGAGQRSLPYHPEKERIVCTGAHRYRQDHVHRISRGTCVV